MATSFKKVSNNGQSTLYADITTTVQTTIQVVPAEATRFPSSGSFWIRVYNNADPSLATQTELMLVTGVAANTFTVTRNADSQGAYTFSVGQAVRENIMAEHVSDLNTAVNTVENKLDGTSSGVTLNAPSISGATITTSTLTSPTVSGTGGTTAGQQGYDTTNKAIFIGDGTAKQSIFTSAWKSYTPTLTNLTLGNGTVTAAYCQVGKLVVYRFIFTLGSTSAVGSAPTVTLPVTAAAAQSYSWPMTILDNGSAFYSGSVRQASTTALNLEVYNAAGTYATQVDITATIPHTWATTDVMSFTIYYEAA